jgi:hypothetical protein
MAPPFDPPHTATLRAALLAYEGSRLAAIAKARQRQASDEHLEELRADLERTRALLRALADWA